MTTKSDYETFLIWLHSQHGVSDDVKRVANTVHANLDRIERTSSNQGQRSRVLAPLLTQNFANIDPARPALAAGVNAQARSWIRLHQISVGPFRGFREPETFDLNKRVVLIYGQNGTGKTSFCEALEHALLGTVGEAVVKRIDADDYLKNVHERRFDSPRLDVVDAAGATSRVASAEDAYRFCFVEKNRIEDFSRMSAKTAALRTELIASLFGMQSFSELVQNFNAEIGDHLTLTPIKGNELNLKRQQLAADNALVANQVEKRAGWDLQEQELATAFRAGATVAELYQAIGTEAVLGRLQELDRLLSAPRERESGITFSSIEDARRLATEAREALAGLDATLAARRVEVNFKSLYESLQGLEQEGLDYCPACTTPLTGANAVLENPFERARRGMAQLSELAELQQKQSDAQIQVTRQTDALCALFRRLAIVNAEGIEAATLFALFSEREGQARGWWDELDVTTGQIGEAPPVTAWEVAQSLASRAEALDDVIRQQNADRARLVEEQARLRNFQTRANSIATLRAQHALDLERAGTNIANFNVTNERLIQDVETERLTIAQHRPIEIAYGQFRARLLRYREDLPRALTANLSQITRNLFNGFNRDDVEGDRLAQLVLPVNATETIKIAFNSHPAELHDALHVLSEGHIRCLGLAMLVAKNIQENCPVLIFDDAVNAIDDEHRSGIGATLFDNKALADKQIIITCHGEEMIKDVENILDHLQARAECLSYTFLPHEGNRVIRVFPGQTRNYILEAQQAVATGRIRAALGHARRATEAVTAKTWKFMGRQNQGELRLKMERIRAPVELYDLATQLKKKIDSATFQHVRKEQLSEGYAAMLEQRAWAVINAGTHEEAGRPDFARERVLAVVNNLATLDEVLAGCHDS